MPKKKAPLSAEQIALLRRWIDQGADWPDAKVAGPDARLNHWAFKAPVRPKLPEVKDKGWVRNPVDAFVIAKLEEKKLAPSPEADRTMLLRRLSLDLIGLPPTPDEVDAFLADKSPDAYEKQVTRLLASPHYGEKWGRQWLDAARYADSDGFEKDKPRNVWFYRDWVINAFNRNLPYDEFIIEQLAGDQLPNATQDQIVATGFLRNSMVNEEGGVDPEQFRMEAMYDRMDAIGKSVLGLTIQCAQCHNHKFDPVLQEELLPSLRVSQQRLRRPACGLSAEGPDARGQPFARNAGFGGRLAAHDSGLEGAHGAVGGKYRHKPARVDASEGLCRGYFHRRPEISAAGGRLFARARLRADEAHGSPRSDERFADRHCISA